MTTQPQSQPQIQAAEQPQNTLVQVTEDLMPQYLQHFDGNLERVLPMLPYVPMEFHNFDLYRQYPKSGLYLMDQLNKEDTCVYHLFKLTPDPKDKLMRTTLVLPSNWEDRVGIVGRSIENVKRWFDQFAPWGTEQLMVQALEYGEIEYYPTLNHYLIPVLTQAGFKPIYRMYMRYEMYQHLATMETLVAQPIAPTLNPGPSGAKHVLEPLDVTHTEALFHFFKTVDDHYQDHYAFHMTRDEWLTFISEPQGLTGQASFILKDVASGSIIGTILASEDQGKLWIDNLAVDEARVESVEGALKALLEASLNAIYQWKASQCDTPPASIEISNYVNRNMLNLVNAYKKRGFVPYEFWADMIYTAKRSALEFEER